MNEQEKIEKVKRDLKYLVENNNFDDYPIVSYGIDGCFVRVCVQSTLRDALALLETQEPIKPEFQRGMWICGKCGYKLARPHYYKGSSYCWNCGKMVKWK